LSEVVESQLGYHLIYCEAIHPERRLLSFAEARNTIREYLEATTAQPLPEGVDRQPAPAGHGQHTTTGLDRTRPAQNGSVWSGQSPRPRHGERHWQENAECE
jgi:hypothetical protein